MFKRIEIRNFQSHKATDIDFANGVNTITGESDNGKTAVIRAMMWVLRNRPAGSEKINSRWNRDFKEPMSVRIYTEKGWCERRRDKKFNGYIINGTVLEAVGMDVPDEVREFFGFEDVNVQLQMDSPYLLSMTPGEASKYLNKVVNLESIDSMLSLAESHKREIASEEKVVTKDIADLKRRLEETSWVDEAERMSLRIDRYDAIISELEGKGDALLSDILLMEKALSDTVDVSLQKSLVRDADAIALPDTEGMEREISEYERLAGTVVDTSAFSRTAEAIDSMDFVLHFDIEDEAEEYASLEKEIDSNSIELDELRGSLPKVCPYCGSPMEGGEGCSEVIS